MTPQTDGSIFFDEWQDCLRSHYIYVIRADDQITEPTLRRVLLQTGLNEDDLEALRDEALSLGPLPLDSEEDVAAEDAAHLDDAYDEEGEDVEDDGGDEDDYDSLVGNSPQLSLF